jgi:hypothetical protein
VVAQPACARWADAAPSGRLKVIVGPIVFLYATLEQQTEAKRKPGVDLAPAERCIGSISPMIFADLRLRARSPPVHSRGALSTSCHVMARHGRKRGFIGSSRRARSQRSGSMAVLRTRLYGIASGTVRQLTLHAYLAPSETRFVGKGVQAY